MGKIADGYTVTYVAMQLAFFMGFKRIYLIGVDHYFQQTGNPNELQTMKANDPNHFDPNYFKGQSWQLADLEQSEFYYRIARRYASAKNLEIYNATHGGHLEVFNRIPFQDSLNIAVKKRN